MDQLVNLPLGNSANMPVNYCDVSEAQDGSLMAPAVVIKAWPLTQISVDVSSATSTAVAPATTGKVNNIARMTLIVGGACTLTVGALVLPFSGPAAVDLVMALKPVVWGASGAALALVTSTAVRVCGKIDYFQS